MFVIHSNLNQRGQYSITHLQVPIQILLKLYFRLSSEHIYCQAIMPLQLKDMIKFSPPGKFVLGGVIMSLLCVGWGMRKSTVNYVTWPVFYNASTSLPTGWYTMQTRIQLKRGDIIRLCLPAHIGRHAVGQGYVHRGTCAGGSRHVGKPVVALAGDTVDVHLEGVRVNRGPIIMAPIQRHDRRGHMMLTARGHYVLEDDECFLLSTYSEYSFDSRYFGPVTCLPPYQVLNKSGRSTL